MKHTFEDNEYKSEEGQEITESLEALVVAEALYITSDPTQDEVFPVEEVTNTLIEVSGAQIEGATQTLEYFAQALHSEEQKLQTVLQAKQNAEDELKAVEDKVRRLKEELRKKQEIFNYIKKTLSAYEEEEGESSSVRNDLLTAKEIGQNDILIQTIKDHNQNAFDLALAKIPDSDINHCSECEIHQSKHSFLQFAYEYNFPTAIQALLARGAETTDATLYQQQHEVSCGGESA